MNEQTIPFPDDWSDFASDDPGAPSGPIAHKTEAFHKETCPRCNGSGRYSSFSSKGIVCFKCNGIGFREFKQSKEQRENARIARMGKKAEKFDANVARIEAAFPDIAAWWNSTNFEFAANLKQAAGSFGNLSDNQLRAARRCIDRDAEGKAVRELAKKTAVEVSIRPIEEVFDRARRNGYKAPKIRLLGADSLKMELSLAGAASINKGAIYVKAEGVYMGKVVGSRFEAGRDCTKALHPIIIEALSAPLDAAKKFGHETGKCSCCGRELTDPASIAAGIGPICESKFF